MWYLFIFWSPPPFFLFFNLCFRADLTPLENCQLLFRDEVFAIEAPGMQMNESEAENNPGVSPAKRECNYLVTCFGCYLNFYFYILSL